MPIDLSGLDFENDQVFDEQAVLDEMDAQLGQSASELPIPGEGSDISLDGKATHVSLTSGMGYEGNDSFPADFSSITKAVVTAAGDVAKAGIQAGKASGGSGATNPALPTNFPQGSRPASAPVSVALAQPAKTGLSTGTKVAIGAGAVVVCGTVIGLGAWAASRPRRRPLTGVR